MCKEETVRPDVCDRLPQGVHFVSGIDTDAGKTVCTGWLARELIRAGRRAATLKLVQTGSAAQSPDIAVHRRLMGVSLPEDQEGITAPECFSYPASPHLAARLDGRSVDFERILKCVHALERNYDTVLVEGAGGLMVPLTETLLTIDFACAQRWPFVFVMSGKLGSINHALLSMEALQSRRARVSAFIYNRFSPNPDEVIESDTPSYLYKASRRRFIDSLWLECPRFSAETLA